MRAHNTKETPMQNVRTKAIEQAIGLVMAGKRSAAEIALEIDGWYREDNATVEASPVQPDVADVRAEIDDAEKAESLEEQLVREDEVLERDDSEEALLNGGPGITDEPAAAPRARKARA